MTVDQNIPATKADIEFLMEQMGNYFTKTEERIADLKEDIERWKAEMMHEFRVVAEDIRHDFRGAFHDKLDQHETRIMRIERYLASTNP